MEGHVQKCLERCFELAHKTSDQTSQSSHTLHGRSQCKARRSGNSWRVVRDMLSDCIDMFVLGQNWKTISTLVSILLGEISHKVEPSM